MLPEDESHSPVLNVNDDLAMTPPGDDQTTQSKTDTPINNRHPAPFNATRKIEITVETTTL